MSLQQILPNIRMTFSIGILFTHPPSPPPQFNNLENLPPASSGSQEDRGWKLTIMVNY